MLATVGDAIDDGHIPLREKLGYSAEVERIMKRSRFTIMCFSRLVRYFMAPEQ